MPPAKDRFGTDGIRFVAAVAPDNVDTDHLNTPRQVIRPSDRRSAASKPVTAAVVPLRLAHVAVCVGMRCIEFHSAIPTNFTRSSCKLFFGKREFGATFSG